MATILLDIGEMIGEIRVKRAFKSWSKTCQNARSDSAFAVEQKD